MAEELATRAAASVALPVAEPAVEVEVVIAEDETGAAAVAAAWEVAEIADPDRNTSGQSVELNPDTEVKIRGCTQLSET